MNYPSEPPTEPKCLTSVSLVDVTSNKEKLTATQNEGAHCDSVDSDFTSRGPRHSDQNNDNFLLVSTVYEQP